jgi:ligand-binding sensor protein
MKMLQGNKYKSKKLELMNIDQAESSKVEKPCTMRCQQGFNKIGMPMTMYTT